MAQLFRSPERIFETRRDWDKSYSNDLFISTLWIMNTLIKTPTRIGLTGFLQFMLTGCSYKVNIGHFYLTISRKILGTFEVDKL